MPAVHHRPTSVSMTAPCGARIARSLNESHPIKPSSDGLEGHRPVTCRACLAAKVAADSAHAARVRSASAMVTIADTASGDGLTCCGRCGEEYEGDECLCRRPRTTIIVTLEIEGDPADALHVVDCLLDAGHFQDGINEHEVEGARSLKVKSATAVREARAGAVPK